MEHVLSSESSSIQEYTGDWQAVQVSHLLKRTLFGATSSDIDHFKRLCMPEAVGELLQVSPAPVSPPLDNYSGSWKTWVNDSRDITTPDAVALNVSRVNSLQCWWIGQLLNQGKSIQEKMTLFWHNHFSVDASSRFSDISARLWYNHYLTLRENALSGVRQLVKAMLTDPALLLFHCPPAGRRGVPGEGLVGKETLARELLEGYLFGKIPFSGFTKGDVVCVARILTGHGVDGFGQYVFQPQAHDAGDKRFSAFFDGAVIKGETGEAGASELDTLLDILFGMRPTALFLCRKLYHFFVDYRLDSDLEENIIQPLADIFIKSGYRVTAVLEALFKSRHFYEAARSGAFVLKSPLDFLIGICREYGLSALAGGVPAQYENWNMLLERSLTMEKEILEIPEPGTAGYNSPGTYRQVILTGSLNNTREYHYKVS